MKKTPQLNQRILRPVLLASILLIVTCLVLVSLYLPSWGEQVRDLQATRTAVIDGQTTQLAGSTNTAVVIAAQQTQDVAATLTAIPTATVTPTSAPLANICTAKVVGGTRAFYLFPSIGYKGYKNISVSTPINLLGRWPDKGWYKVSLNNEEGWMRTNSVRPDDANCEPVVYTVSFLLGLDEPGLTPLLNDSFASNENVWTDSTGSIIRPTTDLATSEQRLTIDAEAQSIVGPDNRSIQDVAAFHLVTSVELSSFNDRESFLGVRFRDNETAYYEIKLFPGTLCEVHILATDQEINNFPMDRKACIGNSYYIELSLSPDSILGLSVNGYDVISSFNLRDNEGLSENGTIRLVVNQGKASFDFITIMSLR